MVARLTVTPPGTAPGVPGIPPRRDWEARMLVGEHPSQTGTAGTRDHAKGAEESVPDREGTLDGGAAVTRDPADAAAGIPE